VAEKNKATTRVTRIKATDTAPKKAKADKPSTVAQPAEPTAPRNPLVAIGGYFKGAWRELRQVRWPNRRATWGLTLAVVLFSVFFVVLILLLDSLFKYIFELIIT
jgi:preprotein translocase subunit SecE